LLPFVSALIRESATEAGVYSTIETIALSPVDSNPAAPAARNFTTNDAILADGWYIIRWVDAAGSTFDSDPVNYAAGGTSARFATVSDVAIRQGKTFTAAESATVTLLLEMATAAIAAGADKSDAWAAALDPVPTIIKGLTIELVGRALANPSGLYSQSETVGSYSNSQSFSKEVPAAFVLTDLERRVVRRTVGSLNYNVRTPTATEAYLEALAS